MGDSCENEAACPAGACGCDAGEDVSAAGAEASGAPCAGEASAPYELTPAREAGASGTGEPFAIGGFMPAREAVAAAAATGRTPLALHACCGSCSLEPVASLRDEGFEPVILWDNPNIQPAAEHDLRLATLLSWAADARVAVIRCERGSGSGISSTHTLGEARDAWERSVAPHGFDREARCRACYAIRLSAAARAAAELGFTHLSTTLAVSPYQLFEACTELLQKLAAANGLTPVVRDWRPLYPEATRESRERGMYRQNYCGCRFSAAEATMERHERRDERKRAKAAARG